MDIKYDHEKILIIVALIFCAGILFYNAFFIPDISIPSVIYVDSTTDETSSPENPTSAQGSEKYSSAGSSSTSNSTSEPSTGSSSGKVNINTATAEELDEKLTGVGPAIAKRIVDYRNSVGKFNSIEEIMNVSGIGEKTFEKFKDLIFV